jgi:hypothetical protein
MDRVVLFTGVAWLAFNFMFLVWLICVSVKTGRWDRFIHHPQRQDPANSNTAVAKVCLANVVAHESLQAEHEHLREEHAAALADIDSLRRSNRALFEEREQALIANLKLVAANERVLRKNAQLVVANRTVRAALDEAYDFAESLGYRAVAHKIKELAIRVAD